jgi:hypothetical protein
MGKKSGKSVTVQQVKENKTDQQVEPTRVRQGNSPGGGQHQQARMETSDQDMWSTRSMQTIGFRLMVTKARNLYT